MFRLILLIAVVSNACVGYAKSICDSFGIDISGFIVHSGVKYVLRYDHIFTDTLFIPDNCEIKFEGGSLSGPIVFNNTKLSGDVNIKGASIRGSIRNKQFNAAWLCNIDGKTDDAPRINEMIEVCGNVYFPKGKYRLISEYIPGKDVDKELHSSIRAHIGVSRSNVNLIGEGGTEFITEVPLGTISLFSQPNQIEKSIRNIVIEGIAFNVKNHGKEFYEFKHTIKAIGVNGLTIKNCTFNDFWGDAICLSHYGDNPSTGERTRNQNVNINNNMIIGGEKRNNRNGISVINGKNVLIKDNIIKNTSRKGMPGGVDVEPNNSAYTIENIRILNNTFEGIKTNAIQIYIPTGGPAHFIFVEKNTIKECGIALNIGILSNETDNLKLTGNVIDGNTNPFHFWGEGNSKNWIVSDNTFNKPSLQNIPGSIKVENLVVKNNKKKTN